MSGVEVIAIVGCVTGLIQALDAGSRIVKQIKQRRQAHGALPPSDLLIETIENGKQQIEQIVAKGTARFGNDFEAGDGNGAPARGKYDVHRLTLTRHCPACHISNHYPDPKCAPTATDAG